MNQTQNIPIKYLSKKLANLSKELASLSNMVNPKKKKQQISSVEGLFKGIKISDQEIENVQKQLYSSVKI